MIMRIGIDLGGSSIKVGCVDENGVICARESVLIGAKKDFASIMAAVLAVCDNMLCKLGTKAEFVGMGVPSSVLDSAIVISTPNLGWKNVNVYEVLEKHFACPVRVANDADCAAMAEYQFGNGKGFESLALFTLGTGVGGGVVRNGRVVTGVRGMGCEPGHMKIVADGEQCGCGRRGCLEAYASARALVRFAMDNSASLAGNGAELSDAKAVFDAAMDGNRIACEAVEEYVHYLAIGISNAIQMFRPECILIGGGVSAAGDILYVPLRKEVIQQTYAAEEYGCPPILPAKLGNDAGMIGAAWLK